jgi:hypothetical protein
MSVTKAEAHDTHCSEAHTHTFPLPRTDFMYLRRGPWPQPAPDHPMAMAGA